MPCNDTPNGIKKALEETFQAYLRCWVAPDVLIQGAIGRISFQPVNLHLAEAYVEKVIEDGIQDGWITSNQLKHTGLCYMMTADLQVSTQFERIQAEHDRLHRVFTVYCAQGNDPSFGEYATNDANATKESYSDMVARFVRRASNIEKPVDNYTCKCGNTKLCTTADKLCWSCGEPVKVP